MGRLGNLREDYGNHQPPLRILFSMSKTIPPEISPRSAMAADRADQMVTWEEDCGCPGKVVWDCGTAVFLVVKSLSTEVKLKRPGLGFKKTHRFC